MSTLSIVVLTVLASLFAILLIAAISLLVYAHILVRRQISAFSLTVDNSTTRMDSQFARIETLVSSIHGDRIQQAAQQFIEQIPRQAAIATRIEAACIAFQGALRLISEEQSISGSAIDRARESGLGPESYASAAPGESYISRSRTSEGDETARAEESSLNTSTFDDQL